jgi:two-component system chemotaxis response regulator CheB
MSQASAMIKVLVVDDSLTMQKFIQQLVHGDDEIEIIAVACDPYEARDLIKEKRPDVLILDIEMPRMDGLTFLTNIMRLRPMPVVMNSSLSQKGAYETIKALEIGAVDYIGKPQRAEDVAQYKVELINKVKRAAKSNVNKAHSIEHKPSTTSQAKDVIDMSPVTQIVAIGASTGGIEALTTVLCDIPRNFPPILVVQHIPANFSTAFAFRLNELCEMRVKEAEHGEKIHNGCCYIAAGGKQMSLSVRDGHAILNVYDGPLVTGHRPSVNALFTSIAQVKKIRCKAAAILTGMGDDGAIGLKELHGIGCSTVVQDKESSIVWGMPQSAIELEPGHTVLPLNDIARFLINSR